MAPKFILDDQVDWIDPQGKLTPDQWMAIHLIYNNFLYLGRNVPGAAKDNPDVLYYQDKAEKLLRNYLRNAPKIQLGKNLKEATESLRQLYDKVSAADSQLNIEVKCIHFRILGLVAQNLAHLMGRKNFKAYFDDIRTSEDGKVISLKALDIISYYLKRIQDVNGTEFKEIAGHKNTDTIGKLTKSETLKGEDNIEAVEEVETQKCGDRSNLNFEDQLCLHYRDRLIQDQDVLPSLQPEIALAFHAITLYLCNLCLEHKRFSKYQKTVIKAVSSYKDGANQKLLEFNLKNANDAYYKLKEVVLNWIEEEYDDDSPESLRKDIFVLASSNGLLLIKDNMALEMATEVLDSATLDEDYIFDSDSISRYATDFFVYGRQLFEKLVADITGQDSGEEESTEETEETEDDKVSYPNYKANVELALGDLDSKRAIVMHLITNNIFLVKLPKRFSTKYRKAVKELYDTYFSAKNKAKTELAIGRANEELLKLHDSIGKILWEENEEKVKDDFKVYALITMAADHCLFSMNEVPDKQIKKALKDVSYSDKTKEYHNGEIDHLFGTSIHNAVDSFKEGAEE